MEQAKLKEDKDKILEELCNRYGVEIEVIQELLDIERKNQFRGRRKGIYDDLRDCLKKSIPSD